MPQVSIIIVCMNRPDNLYPCLESIRSTTKQVSYETLVVAYLYDKMALAKARKDFPWVEFIESHEIRGFSENNNLALRQAKGRYCFVLNDDTELHAGAIDRLVEDFETLLPPDAAIISPKLLNTDGSLQLCGRPEYPSRYYVLQQWHLHREPADNVSALKPVCRRIYRTHNISGAAFLIRTDIFRRLGWFDERFFFTPEDIALSEKANACGFGVYVDADVEITHKWKSTSSKILRATRPAAVRGSLMHFSGFRNWKYLCLALPVWCAEMSKCIKALLQGRKDEYMVYRNITRSIFTHKSPKEIFTKYYMELKNEGNGK